MQDLKRKMKQKFGGLRNIEENAVPYVRYIFAFVSEYLRICVSASVLACLAGIQINFWHIKNATKCEESAKYEIMIAIMIMMLL